MSATHDTTATEGSPARLAVRPAAARGTTRTDWLDSRHTFSFGGYLDPRWMGFRALRVVNDDRVAPGGGFQTHGHRDMEIVTLVIDGALEHRDSTGGGGVLRPGEVQAMSAGRGIRHSEFNPSREAATRFLQVWIEPASLGGEPGYHQRDFGGEDEGRWRCVASRDGRDGSLPLLQDAVVYTAVLEPGATLRHALAPDRHAWLQVATGRVRVGGLDLAEGDGAYGTAPGGVLEVRAAAQARLVLFDLA